MQSKATGNLDEQTITLTSDDGRAYSCRILGMFQFDNKEYSLLLKLGDGDLETVIMQFIEQGDQAIFRTIDCDEEFERVVAYVKELASNTTEDPGID